MPVLSPGWPGGLAIPGPSSRLGAPSERDELPKTANDWCHVTAGEAADYSCAAFHLAERSLE